MQLDRQLGDRWLPRINDQEQHGLDELIVTPRVVSETAGLLVLSDDWRLRTVIVASMPTPKVVIIGAGFGGLQCARALANKPVDVLLFDRNNYHLFTPLAYQVASSLLNPSDIAHPVRSIFRRANNVRIQITGVTGVDFAAKVVKTDDGRRIDYDYVVIAAGSTTNFFGIRAAEEAAYGLKDLPEALELRNHVLHCFEAATRETDTDARRAWLTFVVVGGGPTGVEYAGALSELIRLMLRDDYPELRSEPVRILLIEAVGQVLPSFSERLGREAQKELEKRGIEVRLQTRVLNVVDDTVQLAGGEQVAAKTVVWAAGVKPAELAATIDVPRSPSGRIEVDEFLRVKGREAAFAIGDIASLMEGGRELPMLSAPAMQEGRHVATSVLRAVRGEAPVPFHYWDRGTMATIGRNAAVAQIGPVELTGFLGWISWLFLHLYFLIGFRNRLAVLLGWVWNYVWYDRPIRLITRARERAPD